MIDTLSTKETGLDSLPEALSSLASEIEQQALDDMIRFFENKEISLFADKIKKAAAYKDKKLIIILKDQLEIDFPDLLEHSPYDKMYTQVKEILDS